MKIPLRRITLAMLLLGLYGCGLKGPLYFPPEEKAADKPQLTTSETATQTPVQSAEPGSGNRRTTGTVQP
ncbi:LPS translocon maturation chaperone LptM [Biostraticola tofi]|uniref:LPS-assembly lipoprotein LptM n=1 Tax=Biostraticola tofi TaxID=466109 RepID=A0A4R3YN03_9GAMM|nr:lipoprotein [Biostraticola tofi]TCV93710.1 putative small lipoprotein YifL [Biostraticola tofi]